MNLVVGDFFKSDSDLVVFVDNAVELIGWLRSKTGVLAHLPLAVLRAVLTRWTAHYTAFRRLLKLRPNIESVFLVDDTRPESEKVVFIGKKAAKLKAREMHEIVKDGVFWYAITKIVRHLEPLAIATNAVQGVQVGLDRVLLTFGFLAMWYRTMLDDPASGADEDGVNAILASLESRWKNADQEIFIAALILNPFYRTAPFNTLSCFNNASVTRLLIALYKRLYKVAPPADFHSTLTSYLHGTGLFKGIDDDAQEFITTSIAAVSFFCSLTSHAYRVLIGT
ncbi:hypothetical protein BDZ89DRAFT_951619 [Hymenopellis radicata]|nr:hypothetical protein BDZ89DRAFT_951619 [Hymenopellis radicata]